VKIGSSEVHMEQDQAATNQACLDYGCIAKLEYLTLDWHQISERKIIFTKAKLLNHFYKTITVFIMIGAIQIICDTLGSW